MIFIARLTSVIGAIVTAIGLVACFFMMGAQDKLPDHIMDHSGALMLATLGGFVVLLIGQWAGNDLFKLTGLLDEETDRPPTIGKPFGW